MTLEQYGYLAEIAGVVLIIASLVYVARQLGQTAAMMRLAAANDRVRSEQEMVTSIISDRQFAEIWLKGESNFEALDDVDKQRVIFFEYREIVLWHSLFSLRQQKLTSDRDWHANEWIIQNLGRRQAVRESWKFIKESFERPFQDYIDGQFLIADSAVAQE